MASVFLWAASKLTKKNETLQYRFVLNGGYIYYTQHLYVEIMQGTLLKSHEHSRIQIYLGFHCVMSEKGIERCAVSSRSDPLTVSIYAYVK